MVVFSKGVIGQKKGEDQGEGVPMSINPIPDPIGILVAEQLTDPTVKS
jgi:hypothetical protein